MSDLIIMEACLCVKLINKISNEVTLVINSLNKMNPNKNTLNMELAKVLFTLLRYLSIRSQHIQMFSQLFKLSHLNKQFYTEQYCTSFQHASQLENI